MSLKKAAAPAAAALALVFSMGAASIAAANDSAPSSGATPAAPMAQEQEGGGVNCYPEQMVKENLSKIYNMSATGEKGSDGQFDLEIFANKETGAWAVLGAPLSPPPNFPANYTCMLAGAEKGYPDEVKAQPWYNDFFAPK